MTEKQKAKQRKNNMKVYPIYQMFGYDLMFYYAIEVLFLKQVKNIPLSDIVLLGTLFAICSIILRIPALFVVEKIGKRNSLILGNLCNAIFVLIAIFSSGYEQLIIAQLISAFGFGLKGTAESSLLKESVPKSIKGPDIYTKIEGKAYSKYSYFQATSNLIAGFLYQVNPYIPLIFCLTSTILTTLISFRFIEIESEEKEIKTIRRTVDDIKSGFKFMFSSKRLKALFFMLAAIWGVFSFTITYRTALFEDLQCIAIFIGALSAATCIAKGLASKKANKFNKTYKNKALTVMGETLCIFLIVAGLTSILNIPFIVQVIICTGAFIGIEILKGIYQIISKRYITNFADKHILSKIHAANGITTNIAAMIGSYVASLALGFTNIRYANVIMGVVFIIIIIGVSKYMKTRIGLKPEEYDKKDIIIKE